MNGHGPWILEDVHEPSKHDADLPSLINGELDLARLLTAVIGGSVDTQELTNGEIAFLPEGGNQPSVVATTGRASRGRGPLVMLLLERDQLDRQLTDTLDRRTSVPSPANRDGNGFLRCGEIWTLTFGGETVQLRDAKGLRDIAELLRNPDSEVHCLDLMGSPINESDTGPVIDDVARRAYRRRARELQVELDDAESTLDMARADKARDELEMLIDQVNEATGLYGRPRRAGASAERARSAVRWRIRAAIRKIVVAHPTLGRYLERSIRTGTQCVYRPAEPVDWRLSSQPE